MTETRIPPQLSYTKDHEWYDPATGRMGITDHAQSSLGDVVFCELPEPGRSFARGVPIAVVESVKSVSDLYAPVAGSVRAVNERLRDRPQLVNEDPYGAGWFLEIAASDAIGIENAAAAPPGDLLDAAGYATLLGK